MSQFPPVAAPRRTRLLTPKDELVKSFDGFSGSTLEPRHIEYANHCIASGATTSSRYQYIKFDELLERNQVNQKPENFSMMTSVFDFLLKYVINLLKPKRPQVWRSIKTNNTSFRTRADCMAGAREVLSMVGYSEMTPDSIQFPASVEEPDTAKLRVLAAELLMAKLEVEKYSQASRSSPRVGMHQMYTGGQGGRAMTQQVYRSSQNGGMSGDFEGSYGVGGGSQSRGGYSSLYSQPGDGQPLRAGGGQPMRAGGGNSDQPLRAGGGNSGQPLRAGGVNSDPPRRAGGSPYMSHSSTQPQPMRAGGRDDYHASSDGRFTHPPSSGGTTDHVYMNVSSSSGGVNQYSDIGSSSSSSSGVRRAGGNDDWRTGFDSQASRIDENGRYGLNDQQTPAPQTHVDPLKLQDQPGGHQADQQQRTPPIPVPRKLKKTGSNLLSPSSPASNNGPLGSQEHTTPSRPQKLDSTGSSEDSNAKLKRELEELRNKRRQTTQTVKKADSAEVRHLDQPSQCLTTMPRKSMTTLLTASPNPSMDPSPPLQRAGSSSSIKPSPPLQRSDISPSIKRPPSSSGNRVKFSNDPILIEDKVCSKCSEKLSQKDKFCSNCGTKYASPLSTANLGSTQAETDPGKVNSGSSTFTPASIEKAGQINSHRRERERDMPQVSHAYVNDFSSSLSAASSGQYSSGIDQLKEKEEAYKAHLEKKRREEAGSFSSSSSAASSGQYSSGIDQLKEKEEAYKAHLEKKGREEAESMSGIEMLKQKEEARKAFEAKGRDDASLDRLREEGQHSRYQERHMGISAPRDDKPESSTSSQHPTGIDYLRKKEEAFKEAQRKKGVKEKDLERLPELVQAEEEERKRRESERKQGRQWDVPVQGRLEPARSKGAAASKPNLQNYERKDLVASNYEKEEFETRKMNQIGIDGKKLLDAIKECTPYGYTLGEIQVAFNHCKETDRKLLHYLDTEWANSTRSVRDGVAKLYNNYGNGVGKPGEREARDALAEARGNVREAIDQIFVQRENKIKSLLEKVNQMRKMDNSVPELDWNMAAMALHQNGMDVEETCYVIQSEWLQPLYEYIFSEYTAIAKTDMEEIKKIIKNEAQYSLEARHRLLMAEYRFKEKFRAENVLQLIKEVEVDETMDYPLNYYVDAAKDFDDLASASNFLNKECPICTLQYPIHEMVTMPGCTDTLCKDCFKGHFTVAIKEKGIKHFNCPTCSLPNMTDKEATEGLYIDLFVAMVKEYIDSDMYKLCTEKLVEFNLTKEKGFVWCASDRCQSGFIYDGGEIQHPREIQCPTCKEFMCILCKKPWEKQHEGISCEQFTKWKQLNDPDAQKQGLAAHLNANGIECPQCHMRYDLARGGCMHFRCTRCPNEFCSGCGESFKNGQQCGKLNSCKKKGLHAHHPRDCLFYLRDFDVKELQDFLRDKKMAFNVDPPKEQVEAAKKKMREGGEEEGELEAEDVHLQCRVMLQKDQPEGIKDEECGEDVKAGHAGLCKVHYKEYLVDKINKKKLDPITMYTTDKIKLMLTREEMKVPEQNEDKNADDDDETDEEFRTRLIKHVKGMLVLKAQDGPAEVEDPLPNPQEVLPVEDLEVEEGPDE